MNQCFRNHVFENHLKIEFNWIECKLCVYGSCFVRLLSILSCTENHKVFTRKPINFWLFGRKSWSFERNCFFDYWKIFQHFNKNQTKFDINLSESLPRNLIVCWRNYLSKKKYQISSHYLKIIVALPNCESFPIQNLIKFV